MKSLQVLALTIGLTGQPLAIANETCNNIPIDPASVKAQQQQQNGITYISGGIGIDESCALQQVSGYNLHMTFSTGPDSKYLSGVSVAIQNTQGHELLKLDDAGPIVLTQLPAGKYVVVAQHNGREMRNEVDLKGGGVRTLNIHWNDAS